MTFPNRYTQRINGAFVDGIPTITGGIAYSGQLVALNASGMLDVSMFPAVIGGVTSLNTITGAVTLAAGAGLGISASGQIITITASGGTGGGPGVTSVNGVSGTVIISGGLNTFVSVSGQIIVINNTSTGASGSSDLATRPCAAVAGKPSSGQLVMIYTAESVQTFPANFGPTPQSVGTCGVNPTSTAVYSVFKNLANIGTVSVSPAGVFTFVTTAGAMFSLNIGDRLTVVAPGAPDPTMSDVSITFIGTRSAILSGPASPIFTWQGAYNGSTPYSPYDVVSYLGSSYVCIAISLGNLPTNTSFWNLQAAAGSPGASFGVQTVNGATGAILAVNSVNGLNNAVTISGGNNVSVAVVGQTVVISSSGGGGGGGFSPYPTPLTPPNMANFSWVNQGAATSTTKSNRLVVTMPDSFSGVVGRFLVATATLPATPYTVDIAGMIAQTSSGNGAILSAGVFDGSNTSVTFGLFTNPSNGTLSRSKWSSGGSISLQTTKPINAHGEALFFIRITDDGTTRTFYFSPNGLDYFLYGTEAHNTDVTATHAGLQFYNNGGGAGATAIFSIYHFLVSNSILPQFAA